MARVHGVNYTWDNEELGMPWVDPDSCMRSLSGRASNPFPAWAAPYNKQKTWRRKLWYEGRLTPRDRLFIITIMKAAIKKQMEDN